MEKTVLIEMIIFAEPVKNNLIQVSHAKMVLKLLSQIHIILKPSYSVLLLQN